MTPQLMVQPSSKERAEYAGITELLRIFTFINAQLAAKGEVPKC